MKSNHTLMFEIEQHIYVGENVSAFEKLKELRKRMEESGFIK